MKKTRVLPTRRKLALRWVAALCALALANHLLGLYCVTPRQALRQCSARYGLAPMEIWTTVETPRAEEEALRHWLLSYNDDCLALSTVRFEGWRGWTVELATLLTDTEEPVSVGEGAFLNEAETGYETGYLFFGSVKDPDVTAVKVEVRHASLTEDGSGVHLANLPWMEAFVPADEFQRAGGRRMFLAVLAPVSDPGGSTYPEMIVSFSRADGNGGTVEEIVTGLDRR